MRKFLSDVDHPAARANVDISHLALPKTPRSNCRSSGADSHVHLSDCDGQKHGDLPPGRGIVDFPPYLQALADTGFSGTISIELEYSARAGRNWSIGCVKPTPPPIASCPRSASALKPNCIGEVGTDHRFFVVCLAQAPGKQMLLLGGRDTDLASVIAARHGSGHNPLQIPSLSPSLTHAYRTSRDFPSAHG